MQLSSEGNDVIELPSEGNGIGSLRSFSDVTPGGDNNGHGRGSQNQDHGMC